MDLRNGKRLLLLVSATGLSHWFVSYLVWVLQQLKPQQPRDPWHTQSLELRRLLSALWESNCCVMSCQELWWQKAPHHPPTQNGFLQITTLPESFSHERGVQTKVMSQVLLNVCVCDLISQLTPSSWIGQILNRKRYLERDVVQHHQAAQF